MSQDDLEKYEVEMELRLYREYRDVLPMFGYVVETERRFYLANEVDVKRIGEGPWAEVVLADAWVWDMHRPARFVSNVRIITKRDVNIEQLSKGEALGEGPPVPPTGAP